ncbi:phosphatidylinositol-specific phospholipase C [Aphelenchoides avenae]|nr:phosphatidylinositol-specific phospholipase C [Aphelenchus avenae]
MTAKEVDEAFRTLEEGILIRRIKRSKIHVPSALAVEQQHLLRYPVSAVGPFAVCNGKQTKTVDLARLLEVRQGYNTDGLHAAAKKFEFQERAPEQRCFSVIYKHPKFVCKAIDFTTDDERRMQAWISALKKVIAQTTKNPIPFDEKLWLARNFRKADLDRNGEISFDELWKLLKRLNLQMSEVYVRQLFKRAVQAKNKQKDALNEDEFFHLFEVLTDLPEYRSALRTANGKDDEVLDSSALLKFLTDEQKFDGLDAKKVESIIDFCETGDNKKTNLTVNVDVFDGEHGEPSITHKRTFISAITLRNALKCIKQYAFQTNPFPVILTVENFVGIVQQRVMADIFTHILGDALYIPPDDAGSKPLPSPNELKNKILLRGKAHGLTTVERDDEDPDIPDERKPKSPIDPAFGRLIALPRVKLTSNIYSDVEEHPKNGSPTLVEGKVMTYMEANIPLSLYTATRVIKSYPKGFRQDSSNMDPMPSWLCGIQCAAMNFQTAGVSMDLNNGLFSINGNIGYVLKPKVLLDGLDPHHQHDKVKTTMTVSVICGQYLPRPEPGSDIVDPYVTLEIYGIPVDECKARTRPIRNNGFNPVWNEVFEFQLHCPEVALLRFCVKDFDSTSSNDFVGEYSIPVTSIRPGYSHVRLNTGFEHTRDSAASIFVRIAFS